MKTPFFLLLLPFFFVFHGYVENLRYISFADCLPLLGLYLLATLACFLFVRLFLKDNIKAALMAGWLMSFYFFFGAFHDFTRKHGIFLHRYTIVLPLFLAMTAGLFVWLKRSPAFSRTGRFLNYLLLIYLLLDVATLLWNVAGQEKQGNRISALPGNSFRDCDSCPKPDIYLLLFDEYMGSKTLKDLYHYDNSSLDSFLLQENFHIQENSHSNYFFTPFSMASTLDVNYLTNLKDPQHVTGDDYLEVMDPHRPAAVIQFLERQGYTIINNSSFDLPGNPSSLNQPFIPVKTRLITNRTLFHYLMRDIGWWFVTHFTNSKILAEDDAVIVYKGNRTAMERTIEESKKSAARPRFVYMHVFMPHAPFLFDILQQRRKQEVVARMSDQQDFSSYLNYIPYTNTQLRQLVSTIKKNTMGHAPIIFLSDHGFRDLRFTGHNERPFFNNQNAVYFPDRDYRMLYDSISNVNEFRVVFNKLFRQDIPLLKDSLIYLRDVDSTDNKK